MGKSIIISFAAFSFLFMAYLLALVFVIYPQDEQFKNKSIINDFVELVGENETETFLNEYNIIFLDDIPLTDAAADINFFYHQVRIKNDTKQKMIYALLHEFCHFKNEKADESEIIAATAKLYGGIKNDA